MNDDTVYTGSVTYKDINFTFVLCDNELRLIPPDDKIREIRREWLMQPIGQGVYTFGNDLFVTEEYLKGRCNENGKYIIFITRYGELIGSKNEVLFIPWRAVIFLNDDTGITKINFSSPEIDYIYNSANALEYFTIINEDGELEIKTKNHYNTSSEKRRFFVDNRAVDVNFTINRTFSTKISNPTLNLQSVMAFEFDLTSDYAFIYRLWRIATSFLSYLCYRTNIDISVVQLFCPYDEQKSIKCGEMYLLTTSVNSQVDIETMIKNRYIKLEYLCGVEGSLLTDIANNSLYLRHLPDSYTAGRNMNAARFIMITAAFEWEFRRMYPDGVRKTEKNIFVEQQAKATIQGLIDNSTGKLKDKYKFLKRLITSDPLKSEIFQVSSDLKDIIDDFGKQLYGLNKKILDYSEMSERISQQRNHFAHGDLDKEFIGSSLLDLIFLEHIIYAMQLKGYGIPDIMIKRAINDLFGRNLLI